MLSLLDDGADLETAPRMEHPGGSASSPLTHGAGMTVRMSTHTSDQTHTDLTEFSGQYAIGLRNRICVYCSKPFSDELPKTREHVVGKKFVQKGSMRAAYNLVVNACKPCNNNNGDLENDISVISMHPTVYGDFAADAAVLAPEVERRAGKTYSRNTGKPVAAGEQPRVIHGTHMGMSVSFTMVGPPQASQERQFELARLQLMAFFFHLTYDKAQERGFYWKGDFRPVIAVRKADWGHPYFKWFEEVSAKGVVNYQVCTANGFYKMWIKEIHTRDMHAWAIEWNKNIRLIGFFGDNALIEKLAETMPEVPMRDFYRDGRIRRRMRLQVPMEGPDTLFAMFQEPATQNPSDVTPTEIP